MPNYYFNFFIIVLSCFCFCFINQFLRFGVRPLGFTFSRVVIAKNIFRKVITITFYCCLSEAYEKQPMYIRNRTCWNYKFFTDGIIYVIVYICEVQFINRLPFEDRMVVFSRLI